MLDARVDIVEEGLGALEKIYLKFSSIETETCDLDAEEKPRINKILF